MKSQTDTHSVSRRSTTIAPTVVGVCAGLALSALTYAGDNAEPIAAKPISSDRVELTDDVSMEIRLQPQGRDVEVIKLDDPSRVAVLEFTIQPGAVFPWHTHPGPALAGLEEGELIYIYADDCVERPYPSGTMFIDPGGDNVHTAYNPSDTEEAVVVATILNAPEEGPLTLPVDEGEGKRLDEKCGIER